MKKSQITGLAAGLLLTAKMANAAGFDIGERTIDPLFEYGGYADFSVTGVALDLEGSAAGVDTGNVGDDFAFGSAALKNDISDKWSYAILFDQPYYRDISHTEGLFTGASGYIRGNALTGYLRYKFTDRVSAYAGLRYQELRGSIGDPSPSVGTITFDRGGNFGYSLGVAYEIQDIALRVSLTYDSAITVDADTTISGMPSLGTVKTEVKSPQSVNLKFQSGLSQSDLIFGSVRWVDWSETQIDPGGFGGPDLLNYTDGLTFTLGAAHVFSDALTAFASFEYDRPTDSPIGSPLDTDDNGNTLTVGAIYTVGQTEITGALSYVWLRDRQGFVSGAPVEFTDNSALAATLRVGWRF